MVQPLVILPITEVILQMVPVQGIDILLIMQDPHVMVLHLGIDIVHIVSVLIITAVLNIRFIMLVLMMQ